MLVNDEQIRRAWEGLLMAEIRAAYFGDLVERNNRFQRLGTWLSLVFSSGATVAAFISLAPNWSWLRIVMPVLIALISLWLLTRQYPKMAIESADLHLRWQRLANDYQRLWENVYDDSALETLNGLDDRAAEISKAGTGLPQRFKINAGLGRARIACASLAGGNVMATIDKRGGGWPPMPKPLPPPPPPPRPSR